MRTPTTKDNDCTATAVTDTFFFAHTIIFETQLISNQILENRCIHLLCSQGGLIIVYKRDIIVSIKSVILNANVATNRLESADSFSALITMPNDTAFSISGIQTMIPSI